MKSKSEIAEGAIEILDARGWCQGVAEHDGSVCLGSALVESASDGSVVAVGVDWGFGSLKYLEGQRYERAVAVGKAVLGTTISHVSNIAGWNDAPDRTADQVRDRLTAVAKMYRDRGE